MFFNYKEDARKVLTQAKKEMNELKHPYVGSEHLLLAILKSDNDISNRLKDYDLTYKKFKQELIDIVGIGSKENEWFLYTPLLKRVIENASITSKENNCNEVTIEHLFSSLLEEGEGIAIRIMLGLGIDLDELYSEFSTRFNKTNRNKKKKKLILDELGIDLTKRAANNELDPVIDRDSEINRLLEVLSRITKNNPLLIGEAGVGKTAIVEELSKMISLGNVPLFLKNKRIISLSMASLVAGTKYRGEFEDRMSKVLKEVEDNEDIILFIDEIHTLVGAGGAEGAIDASNIFKPALARGKIRCIGATTTTEYKKFIEKDAALERRFQKILVEPPSKESIKNILMRLKEIYEDFHHVIISEEIIDTIIELSSKYVYDRHEPDKSIDILDEVCAKVSLKETKNLKKYNELKEQYKNLVNNKNKAIISSEFDLAAKYKTLENKLMNEINNVELLLYNQTRKAVTKKDIAEVINIKTHIPVYELLQENKRVIKELEHDLKTKIVGQDKALNEVINIYKKIKLGFKENRCYSFMFIGPSGVGKTELAKIFGKSLVKDNVIKLDMTEFSESNSVNKIIGAPPGYVGYDDFKNVLDEIKNKPYSVLILDEIEKAHPKVINLFYQILDEGKIKDSSGNNIRFDNTVIIMTSNIGFDDVYVGFNKSKDNSIKSKLKDYFQVSFLNRIDNTIVFNNLEEEDVTKLVKLKLNKMKDKYKELDIDVNINKKIIKEIVELSDFKEYGVRRLDKIIKDRLESIIIDGAINNNKKIVIKDISLNV